MIKLKTKVPGKKRGLALIPLLLTVVTAAAGTGDTMMIDIDTDAFQIDQLDISRLSPGDTETVYTDDGRTVDILRKEEGIEIFVDGQPLNLPELVCPTHSPDGSHEPYRTVMIQMECDAESDEECNHLMLDADGKWAVDESHEQHHIVVIKESVETEDEI